MKSQLGVFQKQSEAIRHKEARQNEQIGEFSEAIVDKPLLYILKWMLC
jgi:hypothetical protein